MRSSIARSSRSDRASSPRAPAGVGEHARQVEAVPLEPDLRLQLHGVAGAGGRLVMKKTSQRARRDLRVQAARSDPARTAGTSSHQFGRRRRPARADRRRASTARLLDVVAARCPARVRRGRGTRSGNPRRPRRHQFPAAAFDAVSRGVHQDRGRDARRACRSPEASGRFPRRDWTATREQGGGRAEAHPVDRIVAAVRSAGCRPPISAASARRAGIASSSPPSAATCR